MVQSQKIVTRIGCFINALLLFLLLISLSVPGSFQTSIYTLVALIFGVQALWGLRRWRYVMLIAALLALVLSISDYQAAKERIDAESHRKPPTSR
jgi:hypothetical protein